MQRVNESSTCTNTKEQSEQELYISLSLSLFSLPVCLSVCLTMCLYVLSFWPTSTFFQRVIPCFSQSQFPVSVVSFSQTEIRRRLRSGVVPFTIDCVQSNGLVNNITWARRPMLQFDETMFNDGGKVLFYLITLFFFIFSLFFFT